MVTKADFTARYPNFDIQLVDDLFDLAVCELPLYYNGNCTGDSCDDNAMILLALAHLITLYGLMNNGTNPITGEIQSKSVDGVSVSYQTLQNYNRDDRFWDSTPYGRMFASANRGCGWGAVFV